VARAQDLLRLVAGVVLRPTPCPAGSHGAIVAAADRHPGVCQEPVGGEAIGIGEDGGESVAGRVREPEIG
jgi:hypothetical protein